jgi:DNA-binding CsgD family transcriptional regulator
MRRQDLIEIGQSADLRSFESSLVRLAGVLDFSLINAALVVDQPGHEPIFVGVGNTPRDYAESYADADDSRRDPVLQQLKNLSVPVIYDQKTYVEGKAADLWERQARYGYHTGVAVALHLPNNRHFVLGVDRRDPLPDDDREVTRLMGDLQLLAVHAQDAALRLLAKEQPQVRDDLSLTPRELEVLKLTMEGLTAAAIADRVAISVPTVNFHLRNLREKLGASSKHQAVLRALSLGLL